MQFVVNYEEGGERNILHGDATSEAFSPTCSERSRGRPAPHERGVDVRIRLARGVLAAVAVVQRAEIFRPPCSASRPRWRAIPTRSRRCAKRWEIASHGLKWIDYKDVPEAERAHLAEAIRIHTQTTGERPLGWYTGRNSVNTLKAVLDEGGFLYSSDSYADDLPYWVNGPKGPHLIIPYTLDANDMRFINPQGFATARRSSAISRTPSTCSMRKANARPR